MTQVLTPHSTPLHWNGNVHSFFIFSALTASLRSSRRRARRRRAPPWGPPARWSRAAPGPCSCATSRPSTPSPLRRTLPSSSPSRWIWYQISLRENDEEFLILTLFYFVRRSCLLLRELQDLFVTQVQGKVKVMNSMNFTNFITRHKTL